MTLPSCHRLVDEYLTARRGLGFDLETAEGLLRDFASHADRIGHDGPVTIELAVQWARSSRSGKPAQAARWKWQAEKGPPWPREKGPPSFCQFVSP